MSKAHIHLDTEAEFAPSIPVTAVCRAPLRSRRFHSFSERNPKSIDAFTLIELLVVISIIGILAGLTLGLASLAGRKGAESRVRGEMTKLINAIENYKVAVGSYPPDHPGFPSTNQLFYELSGTLYTNIADGGSFYIPGRQDLLPAKNIPFYFGSQGFANAARDPKELKFTESFKASQVKRIKTSAPIEVLAVPMKGPANRSLPGVDNLPVNPWFYVSTSPTNNPDRFDLWAEVLIRGKVVRFSNWEKDPVVLTP